MISSSAKDRRSIAIVGGGLAGMAAAVAAVERGFHVTLFERGPALGGRAGSFRDPKLGRLVDLCPHVAMGCCTELLDFCRRTGIDGRFARHRVLHFFGPDGRRYDFAAVGWLPAPLHLLPGLMRLGYLTLRDRGSIVRAMLRLVRTSPGDDGATIGRWLREQHQSQRAIERFWTVVLVSALGDTVDRVSRSAARKVFIDGFLGSRDAYEVLVPQVPLGQLWREIHAWLVAHGVEIHLRRGVAQVEGDSRRATGIVLADGSRQEFDHVIAAVSWRQIGRLLCPALRSALPELARIEEIEPSPITAVHLRFDRRLSPLPHAAIVGRLSQWVFQRSAEPHYEVVISASHGLLGRPHSETVSEVLADLATIWPDVRDAELLGSRVVTQPAAVFSVRPGIDRLRPGQKTAVSNLFLAGDWTSTGWPATMEGAVRSGRMALESIPPIPNP